MPEFLREEAGLTLFRFKTLRKSKSPDTFAWLGTFLIHFFSQSLRFSHPGRTLDLLLPDNIDRDLDRRDRAPVLEPV